MKRSSLCPGRFALTGVAAAALCLTVPSAYSLGLGRLVVRSALGETLRAEIDVTSLTAEENANLKINVAPPEAYRAAGMDYNAVLPGTRAVLQVRDGRTFLGLTSDRVVLEPFVDVILELEWNSGRLVREYTLLLDPPPTSSAKAPRAAPAIIAEPVVVTTAPVAPPVPSRTATTTVAPSAPPPAPAVAPLAAAAAAPAVQAKPAPNVPPPPPRAVAAVAAAASSYRVKAGDTLSHIASRKLAPGVSLDQMLVAIYQASPEAFMQQNMNLLKAGAVLTVPNAESVEATSHTEAHEVVVAHSADFDEYRQRIASAVGVARTDGTTRRARGKVGVAVQDRKQIATATPDKLKLSKSAEVSSAAAVADRVSKEREAKEFEARTLELQKNVAELKQLSSAASAAVAGPDVATAAAPPPSSVLVDAPIAAAPPPSSGPVAETVASASPTVTAAASQSIATPPPPEDEQDADAPGSFLDDNGLALGIGGLTLAFLLGGYGAFRYVRRAKKQDRGGGTSFLESRLQPDSFFGASGGQRIDTRDAGAPSASMSYSLSQIDAIGDVDPVAEADVYLAYGRDLQAEEILKEAMRTTPERAAVRLKLLEVYAKRRDARGFESLAAQVFGMTRGEGEDWEKVQQMGAQLDPDNPLYQPGGKPEALQGLGGGDLPTEPLGESTAPQSVLPSPSQYSSTLVVPVAETESFSSGEVDIDLDLGLDLDLDIAHQAGFSPGTPSASELTQPLPFIAAETQPESMDFELPLEAPPEPFGSSAPVPLSPPTELPSLDAGDSRLSLDFQLTSPPSPEDIGKIEELSAPDQSDTDDDGVNPLVRKLDLAEEFRQIGDLEGARDLLQEVIDKADGALKTKAQSIFGKLR